MTCVQHGHWQLNSSIAYNFIQRFPYHSVVWVSLAGHTSELRPEGFWVRIVFLLQCVHLPVRQTMHVLSWRPWDNVSFPVHGPWKQPRGVSRVRRDAEHGQCSMERREQKPRPPDLFSQLPCFEFRPSPKLIASFWAYFLASVLLLIYMACILG